MDPSAYSDAPKGMWRFLRDRIQNWLVYWIFAISFHHPNFSEKRKG